MLEYSVFKSQVETYQTPSPLSNNIRYSLSKKKIDELFVKWLSMPQTLDLVKKVSEEVKKSPQSIINSNLNAFLSSIKTNLSASGTFNLNNSLKPNSYTPPKSPWKSKNDQGLSESGESSGESPRQLDLDKEHPFLKEKPREVEENKDKIDFNLSKEKDRFDWKRQSAKEEEKPREAYEKDIKEKNKENIPKLTETQPTKEPLLKEEVEKEPYVAKPGEYIPRFYTPGGDKNASIETLREIDEIFASHKDELTVTQFEPITSRIFQIPKFLNSMAFARVDKDKRGKVSKASFLKVWKNEYAELIPQVRCFNILKKNSSEYIETDDIKPIINILLEIHPGLEFLKATPEFQERYTDTVIQRILYGVDKNDDGRISRREFKNSNIFKALQHVDTEDDINKVRAYFSYEHFYVLYCKFWELDQDHDFIINKEEFSKYSGHALSKKTVDRIFDQVPRKFRCKVPGKMSYDDFIWFCLCEEDKTTDRSIEYWFKVVDLDQNDMVTGYELEYFYDEQKQRLEYLNHEPVFYEDFVCQMVDLFKPEKDIIFKMEHLKAQRNLAGVFFNGLTNLNKFVAYEQRDPFMIKNELTENPDFTEWDRFAQHEYIRLALEEENPENSGMLDSADLWDGDEGDKQKN